MLPGIPSRRMQLCRACRRFLVEFLPGRKFLLPSFAGFADACFSVSDCRGFFPDVFSKRSTVNAATWPHAHHPEGPQGGGAHQFPFIVAPRQCTCGFLVSLLAKSAKRGRSSVTEKTSPCNSIAPKRTSDFSKDALKFLFVQTRRRQSWRDCS